jgi:hypothetical protein
VAELHVAEMAAADRAAAAASTPASPASGPDLLAALIGASVHDAATRNRTRYELALESTRQPALAEAMSRLGAAALGATLAEHFSLGLPTTAVQVQALIALYNGTLLTLVVAPPETVTPEATLALARCLVTGVLHTRA